MNSDIKKHNLQKAIVRVIAFFDIFDYPLTAFEIWKYLGVKCELSEVVDFLESDQNTPQPLSRGELNIEEKNNFYFLKGGEDIVQIRLKRYNYADEKFKRALRVSQIFKFIPWIKGIAIGNVIGAHNLKKEGDIDFFVIIQKNRIWISRFYCVLITKILGLRPRLGKTKDKICLSFFVSEDNLNLKNLMLDSKEVEFSTGSSAPGDLDIYFIHWLAGIVPIYDSENIFEEFFQENSWLKKHLPNWQSNQIHFKREVREKNFCKIFSVFGFVGNKFFKFLQLKMMNKKLKELMNKDTRVVINDQILKLHANDRRKEYREKFLNYNI